MTALTTEQADRLLNNAIPVAAELVISVRDWDPTAVAAIIEPLDTLHTRALLVALAALVPADQPLGDLASWTHADLTVPLYAEDQLPVGSPSRGEKPCSACRRVLPLVEFHRDASRRDGRTYRCRSCVNTGLTIPDRAKAAAFPEQVGEVAA